MLDVNSNEGRATIVGGIYVWNIHSHTFCRWICMEL
jgi:hypothetical protein